MVWWGLRDLGLDKFQDNARGCWAGPWWYPGRGPLFTLPSRCHVSQWGSRREGEMFRL